MEATKAAAPIPVSRSMVFWGILIACFIFGGCAAPGAKSPELSAIGFYHEVQKGETLWGIARSYQVDVKQLIEINRLPDPTSISVGQLLYIPD